MNIWVYTGEFNAKRIRERYLQSILRQDIAFFDNVGAGEVLTRIQTDNRESGYSFMSKAVLIYQYCRSCSARHVRKSAHLCGLSFFSAFFTGFIQAYLRLAPALTSII
jgi:ATP-binding cassette subfamily B (MDR/TAP) protein 1